MLQFSAMMEDPERVSHRGGNWLVPLRSSDGSGPRPVAVRRLHPEQVGKILMPLLGLLAVLGMVVAAVAVVLQIKERDLRVATEQELALAWAEKDDLTQQLAETRTAKIRTEDELARVRTDLEDSRGELALAVTAQRDLTQSVEDREQEIARLTSDLDGARDQTTELSNQLAELQEERSTLQRQLSSLESTRDELESQVLELAAQPTVELGKVVVSGAAGQPVVEVQDTTRSVAVAGTDGQVMVVNLEYEFIVMNLGKSHGLSVGQEFHIVRGADVLGRVKVEKVYEDLSAAAILPGANAAQIQKGDAVRAL